MNNVDILYTRVLSQLCAWVVYGTILFLVWLYLNILLHVQCFAHCNLNKLNMHTCNNGAFQGISTNNGVLATTI